MSGTIYFWVALPVLAAASMGCNIVAPVAYAIGPEPKIAAFISLKISRQWCLSMIVLGASVRRD